MSELAAKTVLVVKEGAEEKRPIPYRNLAVGAFMNIFQGVYE